MVQVKIYGHAAFLQSRRTVISEAVQRASVQVLGVPGEQRFHRFIGLADADFVHPADRSGAYLILEIQLVQGRGAQALRAYLLALQALLEDHVGIAPNDLDIVLTEIPPAQWGLRGRLGDESPLPDEAGR